jgi:hypothetical protein
MTLSSTSASKKMSLTNSSNFFDSMTEPHVVFADASPVAALIKKIGTTEICRQTIGHQTICRATISCLL